VTLYHAIANQLLSPPREATIKERLQHAHSVGTVSPKVRPFMKALARAFTMTDEACRSPRESMGVYAVRSHPRDDPCHLEPRVDWLVGVLTCA